MTIGERVKKTREEKGYTQEELASKLGYKSRSSVNKIEKERDIPRSMVVKLAEVLGVTPSYLMGWDETDNPKPNAQKLPNEFIRMIPVFESVSAGFGANAENRVLEFIPIFIQSDCEAENTICLRVCGDSMHPQIQDGDLVQVHKQETAETGNIVVILDGDDAYVKRFIRTPQGITLESFNPNYPPMRFSRTESNRLRVVGIVRRIVRDL